MARAGDAALVNGGAHHVDEASGLPIAIGQQAVRRSERAQARMEAARAFIVATGVQGTPSIIVNGRYRVIGRSFGDMLRITDLLVARERAAAAP